MKTKPIIAIDASVSVSAAQADKPGPRSFESTFYTGGALEVEGYDLPVVVDLAGLSTRNSLVANLDHISSQRVGNFTVANDGTALVASGVASAATSARDEVIASADDGFQWQASIEARPQRIETVARGKQVSVNGREFTGPLYVARKSVLKGFAFVSHGADDNTTATIAASAAHNEGKAMKAEIKAWAESMGIDVENITPEHAAQIEANYEGQHGKKPAPIKGSNPFEARKIEAKRREEIRDHADKTIERRGDISRDDIEAIEKMVDHAIDAGMSLVEFKCELYEAMLPHGVHMRPSPKDRNGRLNGRVLEAAICQTGRLPGIDSVYTDQELQAAHDEYRGGIGPKELIRIAAKANGYSRGDSSFVNEEMLRAAFQKSNNPIHGGFSTIDIATIVSNVANKFIMRGWLAVDQTPLRVAKIQSVRDFKTITTVSLTDSVIYEQVGPSGQIKHGTLGELTYTNKADTYARMLAITRQDIINDDTGALTDTPQRLGNGAMKLLNHIFWTEFLSGVTVDFFHKANNANLNDGVANMTIGGLTATEAIFLNQTNPDGTPLGVQPAIILVPTALKAAAIALMDTQSKLITGASATLPDVNVFAGRFRVESSPYISNTSYTGATSVGWWMLANPDELPVIAIAALNGQVEPTVETADADFNTLGIQMRGYSDVGVKFQEYRGGVYADGGDS